MTIGVARVTLTLPGAQSLKDKRQVVKSLLARLQNRFNVSASEIEQQDRWGVAVIGITCASTDARHADEMLGNALRFVESNGAEYYVSDIETETISAL